MSLSQIRTYFSNRLLEVDSDFREHPDGFNRDNISSTNFDKSYFIFPGNLGSVTFDQITDDSMIWRVELFFKGYRDPQEAIDNAIDVANLFRLQCVKREFCLTGENIKNVLLNSMTVNPVDTNDNLIIIELQFAVRLAFCP